MPENDAPPDEQDGAIAEWLTSELGGTVRSIRRQPRWRPVWFVELERDGEAVELCVRGHRTDTALVFPLEHEMRFQSVLEEHGIPVPAVHGWIPSVGAFVMDAVPGRPDFDDTDGDERDAIVDQYLQTLARLHSLPVGSFAEAGIVRAAQPTESATIGMEQFERLYRAQKNRPDPLMEFGLGWFHRHPPRSQGREGPVVWDSGQFHHHGGQLIALIDLELGHVGDPMMDLAGWRMRDSVIPFGDFSAHYDRYAALTGTPVDLEAVQLHHFAFTMSNQLSFSHRLRNPQPDTDLMTYMQWCNETNLYVTDFLGEYLDLELPEVDVPEPRPGAAGAAHHHLVRSLRSIQVDAAFARYRLRIAFRLAAHLERVNEIGAAVESSDLDDLEQLFGHRPETWLDGEAELERFVLADATIGRHDEVLIGVLHKRNLRAQMLNGAPGSAMTRHNPIQRFHT